MNHDAPREIMDANGKPTGRWYYTCRNELGVLPIGYCMICAGHATAKEACEHYREFLLENTNFQGPKTPTNWPKQKCRVDGCNNEGTHIAEIPGYHWTFFDLCEQHYNVESIAPLIVVGESFHS